MTNNGTSWPGGPPPRYPLYLLPSFTLPTESSLSSSVGSSQSSSYTLSRLSFASSSSDYVESLEEQQPENPRLLKVRPDTIRCSTCSTDLAFASQIVSKGFTGRYGRAYLVSPPENDGTDGSGSGSLVNIKIGKPESRLLVTGSHIVADVTCNICHAKVGWKYVDAKEESQKYKVGKYILETHRTVDYKHWEDAAMVDVPEFAASSQHDKHSLDAAEPVMFNSDDEDECEDIFSGTWDAAVVAKRRARKRLPPSR
ncbi:hypothetical protein PG991_007178 [Apiospora marii]|uniref:Yippee domain-containing protein n=1 Tax=Apiospora marii TaxID=335849 RepID=A0ABR1RUU2_9PEZI